MHNLPNARKSCERRKWVQVWPGFRLIWPNWRVPWVFSVTKLLKSCKLHSIWMQHCVRDCESCRREKRRLTTSYSTRVWDDWQLQGAMRVHAEFTYSYQSVDQDEGGHEQDEKQDAEQVRCDMQIPVVGEQPGQFAREGEQIRQL